MTNYYVTQGSRSQLHGVSDEYTKLFKARLKKHHLFYLGEGEFEFIDLPEPPGTARAILAVGPHWAQGVGRPLHSVRSLCESSVSMVKSPEVV